MQTQTTLFNVPSKTVHRKNKKKNLIYELGETLTTTEYTEWDTEDTEKYYRVILKNDTPNAKARETHLWTMEYLRENSKKFNIPVHLIW